MAGIKNKKIAEMENRNGIQYRKCTECEEWLTLDMFYSNCKNNPYWIDSVCKDCRKKKSIKRQNEKHDEIIQQKRDKKLEVRGIQSPFNYMGNKYLLLPQILPLIPNNIDICLDLFCGSSTFGINCNAKKIICNDKNIDMINFFNFCKQYSAEEIINRIKDTIKEYKLDSNNIDNFNHIRNDFNDDKNDWYIFYTLVTYSYNQNPMYNKKGKYDAGYGQDLCHFNFLLEKRLTEFISRLKEIDIEYINRDFKNIDFNKLNNNDFVYADPPYLISSKTYEWNLEDEKALLDLLDNLNERGIKFALSNVLKHKKGMNDLLIKWSRKYNTHGLQKNYSRMSKGEVKNTSTTEVLITNY